MVLGVYLMVVLVCFSGLGLVWFRSLGCFNILIYLKWLGLFFEHRQGEPCYLIESPRSV